MKWIPVRELAWGGGIVALGLAGTLARQMDLVEQDTLVRLVMGAIGLMVADFGNRAPKALAPSAAAAKLTRVAGWAFALSGLVYAALWAFAPVQVAITAGTGAVALGVAVTLAYSLRLRRAG